MSDAPFVPPGTALAIRMHKAGQALYGGNKPLGSTWNAERPFYVFKHTDGREKSSKRMTRDEMLRLIGDLERKMREHGLTPDQPPVDAPPPDAVTNQPTTWDVNDFLMGNPAHVPTDAERAAMHEDDAQDFDSYRDKVRGMFT